MSTYEDLQSVRLRAAVEKFINERSEFVTALKNSSGNDADYHRWSGHAEARRQLAEDLGWTVPYEPSDRTAVKVPDGVPADCWINHGCDGTDCAHMHNDTPVGA